MPASKPYIVGLTGGIGTGKSEAAKFLSSLGAIHIDSDAISHALTALGAEALGPIGEAFGDEVFDEDNALNRKALSHIIFEDPAKRRILEGILHPRIQREIMHQIDIAAEQGAKIVILDVPLLYETGMDVLCNETWVLIANEETQVARVMMRDRIGRDQAEARIQSQMPTQEKAERASVVISTDRPIEKTQTDLASLYQQALKKL